jgi:hypothetical protein
MLEYEQWALDEAIAKLEALRLQAKAGSPADSFYSTISEVLHGLNDAMRNANAMRRAYSQLVARVDILERLLLMHLPEKELVTHDIINQLKNH